MKKTVGIIGGMGPLASCDLVRKIIKFTDASCDQEHIHVILENDTDIPDRTAAILGEGPDPTKEMIACGKRLTAMGAELLVMHCNTAHYFYDKVADALSVPLLHIPMETATYLFGQGIKQVGILGTTGTNNSGIYTQALERHGIKAIYPNDSDQEILMTAIYGYAKGGDKGALNQEGIRSMLAEMKSRGASSFIMACTEIPLVLEALPEYADLETKGEGSGFINPTDIIAKRLITLAGYKIK